MPLVDDYLRLLSTATWFDAQTGKALLALRYPAALGDSARREYALPIFERSGLLKRHGDCYRVVEPIRSQYRSTLFANDPDLYGTALQVYAEHSENGLRAKLREIMGPHGSRLNIAALRAAANPGSASAYDQLVDTVRNSPGRERDDATAAADLLELYSFKRDRRVAFMRGLALWLSGRKLDAASAFEAVLADHHVDKASAISAHLLAVHRYSEGDLDEARFLLDGAIEDLQQIKDVAGLIMTLTTLGRVQRDIYRETEKDSELSSAFTSLHEAEAMLSKFEDRTKGRLEASLALALSQCYSTAGQGAVAIRYAERTVELSAYGEDAVWSRSVLASLYRDNGRVDQAERLLEDALEIAHRDGVADRSFARALNVFASSERRLGRLELAARHARESLALGRKMQDLRHIAHAGHTLAAVYLDMAISAEGTRASDLLSDAEALLVESIEILAGLRNTSGVDMVQRTFDRLIDFRSNLSDA